MQIDSGSDHSSLMNYQRVNAPDAAVFSVVLPSESMARVASLLVHKLPLRLPLYTHKVIWVNNQMSKTIRLFCQGKYVINDEHGKQIIVEDALAKAKFHSAAFCKSCGASIQNNDEIQQVVTVGYAFTFWDCAENYLGCSEATEIPNPQYFDFLKSKHPDTALIKTLIDLQIVVFTPQSLTEALHRTTISFYDEALFRTIEVWGDKISKDTVKKLCAATGRKTQSVSSVLGNGVKDGWAFKELGEWTFDIPLMLNKKRLKPLAESAKTAIKRRAYERKSK